MSTKSLKYSYNKIVSLTTLLATILCSLPEVRGLVAFDSNRCRMLIDSPQLKSSHSYDKQRLTNPNRKTEPNQIQPLQNEVTNPNERQQQNPANNNRRTFLLAISTPYLLTRPPTSNALSLFDGSSNRRQLELCLVTILRTQYWAMNVAKSMKSKLFTPTTEITEGMNDAQRRQPYLEARLGAKALLTQKIGGGANANVVKLASFHIKECLADGKYWCNERIKSSQYPLSKNDGKRICNTDLMSTSENLVEALGSLVEFDGLETTIDPSPRSSLMLTMYTPQKGEFVYRTLTERVIPSCAGYLNVFEDKRGVLMEFIRREYSEEIPFEVLEALYDESEVS
ncbi:hypothetical protein HJC23_004413 [Cyclotella cryptica]|uniref:Uncharacterized protein n=1 Tax=Cyclotella cryptica TaxID=29204 RepID=A0ABD3QEZ5_9STRA|eukprot:CCRYP_006025-RA/>CCRYP_006025-RA protein AED:0.00 eAED:0.00 QI:132/-1/1/1/-1/1/1/214/339